jgi:hypothetical protein
MITCECAGNWRVELVELTTGQVLDVVVPISFEFETNFLTAGRGSLTFHRKGSGQGNVQGILGLSTPVYVPLIDMYPRRMAVYISRLAGGSASSTNPVPMFAGIVDTLRGSSNGIVTLGFFEIQKYLDYRLIRSDMQFLAVMQTDLAEALVLYARGENTIGGSVDPDPSVPIRLFGASHPTTGTLRTRTGYLASERPLIGKMLDNLFGVLGGPVYQMSHSRSALGVWTSTMEFYDEIPQTVVKTISAANVTGFEIGLEGSDLASLIDAFGKPAVDGTPLIVTEDATGNLLMSMPRSDATPAYPTVSDPNELLENAEGYAQDRHDVHSEFQFYFSGLEYGGPNNVNTLTVEDLVPGNQIYLDVHSQNWRILADANLAGTVARIGKVSVSVPTEGPEEISAQVISNNMDNIASQDGFFYPCTDC